MLAVLLPCKRCVHWYRSADPPTYKTQWMVPWMVPSSWDERLEQHWRENWSHQRSYAYITPRPKRGASAAAKCNEHAQSSIAWTKWERNEDVNPCWSFASVLVRISRCVDIVYSASPRRSFRCNITNTSLNGCHVNTITRQFRPKHRHHACRAQSWGLRQYELRREPRKQPPSVLAKFS